MKAFQIVLCVTFLCAVCVLAIIGLVNIATPGELPPRDTGPLQLTCYDDYGRETFKSQTFTEIDRDSAGDWRMTGDGLTGWEHFRRSVPGETCVVKEAVIHHAKAPEAGT
jgi:hypothetical protein